MARPDFVSAFRPRARAVARDREPFPLRCHRAGTLVVPSGRIATADPLSAYELEPLGGRVPPGRYPVDLAIAEFGEDERVAAARVRLADDDPVRWEMATREGDDLATLPPGHLFGYGVDAGTGCFADGDAAQALEEESVQAGLEQALQATRRYTWAFAEHPIGEGTVVAFSSGWGDGFYASYWGFGADGAVVALCTDFGLLTEPVERELVLTDLDTEGPIAAPTLDGLGTALALVRSERAPYRPLALEIRSTRSVEVTPIGPDGSRAPVDTCCTSMGSDWTWWFGPAPDLRIRLRVLEALAPMVVVPA